MRGQRLDPRPAAVQLGLCPGRLRIHDREKNKARLDPGDRTTSPDNVSTLGLDLKRVGTILETSSAAFKNPFAMRDLSRLNAFNDDALSHELKQVERISKNSEFWPGIYTTLLNLREWHSVTFTTDFFGGAESRALLKTLYDRICRSALNRMKELGFDISDYRDESGRYSIQADSIEQLVVGEQVYMERKAKAVAQAGPGERKEVGGAGQKAVSRSGGAAEAAA